MKYLIAFILLLLSVSAFPQALFNVTPQARPALVIVSPSPEPEPEGTQFLTSADKYIWSGETIGDSLSVSDAATYSFSAGDTVAFLANDTINETVTISSSGTSGNEIVFAVAGFGKKPVIRCDSVITGWTLHSGNIYKTTLATQPEQLFVNGKRMRLARTPNSGYLTTTSTNGSTTVTSTSLDGGIDYTGAYWIGRTTPYNMYSRQVASSSSQTITLESAQSGIGTGEGFILTNKLEFLDQGGEWFFDASTNTLYLQTEAGDSPANYTVTGSVCDYGINITAKNYVKVQDLVIHGAIEAGVYVSNSDHVTVDNCEIYDCEQLGILSPSDGSNNSTFSNNVITGSNRSGIRTYADNSVITGNTIIGTSRFENLHKTAGDQFGQAIYARADDCTITYNKIQFSAYSGIHFFGVNTQIHYNLVDSAMQVLGDGGAIYTYNSGLYTDPASSGSDITYNIVTNSTGNREGYTASYDDGYGIYMDNRTRGVDIENNTVHNCNCGIYLHEGGDIYVQYNKVSDCNVMLLTSGENADSYYYNNTLYAYDELDNFIWWSDDPQRFVKEDGASAVYDYNTYVNNYNTSNIFNNTGDWTSWQAGGDDPNSTFSNTTLPAGDYEKLLYNASAASIDTTITGTWKYINGTSVTFPVTIPAYESIIITGQ